jgi:cytidylate kinase
MSCRVVCVSGPDGAGMREVAQGVAERLGFQLVDEEIVMHAAAEAGVEPQVVSDVERRQSFMDRMLTAFSTSAEPSAFVFASGGGFIGQEGVPLSEELRELIRTAIVETADRGNAVIVAHAAAHALAEREDVLRVLVTASRDTRRDRVATDRGLSEKDAGKVVDDSDAGRSDYLRRFYGEKAELPEQYDVVVNTDRLSPDAAVELVSVAVGTH